MDDEFVFFFLQTDQTFVCVDNLLEIYYLVGDKCKWVVMVKLAVKFFHVVQGSGDTDARAHINSTGKVTTPWNKIYVSREARLQLTKRPVYFFEVLMCQCFIR